MKNRAVQNYINLETLAGGAFAEKLNEALMEVAKNIQNQNTEATAKRGITVNIKFSPDKKRQMVSTTISVATKLAPTESIDTQIIVGTDIRSGDVEIAEYDGQIRGQISIDEAMETATEPDDQPIDLRNRGQAAADANEKQTNNGVTPFRAKA